MFFDQYVFQLIKEIVYNQTLTHLFLHIIQLKLAVFNVNKIEYEEVMLIIQTNDFVKKAMNTFNEIISCDSICTESPQFQTQNYCKTSQNNSTISLLL